MQKIWKSVLKEVYWLYVVKKNWMQISELKGLNDPFTIENSENFQCVYQVFESCFASAN